MKTGGYLDGLIGDGERKTACIPGDCGTRRRGHAFVSRPKAEWIELRELCDCRQSHAKSPYEEPHDISETTAKKPECFEHERHRGSDSHCGQREQKEWKKQRSQMKSTILG